MRGVAPAAAAPGISVVSLVSSQLRMLTAGAIPSAAGKLAPLPPTVPATCNACPSWLAVWPGCTVTRGVRSTWVARIVSPASQIPTVTPAPERLYGAICTSSTFDTGCVLFRF